MSLQRQIVFWVGALAVLVALIWLLSGMLLPFAAGLALAYFLDPVADRFERIGLPRWQAALVILLGVVLVLVVAMVLLVPLLGTQLASFVQHLPSYTAALQGVIAELSKGWLGHLIGPQLPDIQKSLGDYLGQGVTFLAGFVTSLWSGGRAIVGVISVLVVTPVVAFYILVDWDRMIAKVDSWLPLPYADTIRGIARDIDSAIAGFLRGQALVCLILGLFYATGLTVVGLSFGLLIGFCVGVGSFIPYVGSIVGFVIAMAVALVQFWPDWQMLLAVLVVFGIGQFLEGYVLSPRLVGGSVGLHPVWLMFALLASGSLFGFVGLLVAVPVAAAIGVLVRFALARYLQSSLYTGETASVIEREASAVAALPPEETAVSPVKNSPMKKRKTEGRAPAMSAKMR